MARPDRLNILARPAFSSGAENPYTTVIYTEVEKQGHRVVEYRLDRALSKRWDVVHLHWPESVFNHTWLEAWVTTESLLQVLGHARSRGAKVLWTVHNLRAHERRHADAEARFRQRFLRQLDGIVGLSHSGIEAAREQYPRLSEIPAWVVPHPHYKGRYPDEVDRRTAKAALGIPEESQVLLSFGRLFEYKNVPALIRAVRQAPDEPWVVIVAGQPRDSGVERSLRQAAGNDARIRFECGFIRKDRVQHYFRAAALIVQPYREILNSGTALLALSFDRPVLLPKAGAGSDLARDPGEPWVQTYEGELTPAVLRAALLVAGSLPETSQGEQVASFEPERVGAAMVRCFSELVAS